MKDKSLGKAQLLLVKRMDLLWQLDSGCQSKDSFSFHLSLINETIDIDDNYWILES